MIPVLLESVTGTYLLVQTSLFSILFPWIVTWAFTYWNTWPFISHCFSLSLLQLGYYSDYFKYISIDSYIYSEFYFTVVSEALQNIYGKNEVLDRQVENHGLR